MPVQSEPLKLSLGQFAERHRREMIPLSKTFSYLSAAVPLSEEDIREYLEDPIAALPPAIASRLPKVSILLVPYLERYRDPEGERIAFERPAEKSVSRAACKVDTEGALLAFAVKDQELGDYHYRFYKLIAGLAADQWPEHISDPYARLLDDELAQRVHGEVDEESWRLKDRLLTRARRPRRSSKLFQRYLRQSYIDTLTLYLHGICCDIDVEAGPRQLPSRYLRKRLQLFRELYPPPEGYAVFPEEVNA